MIHREVVGGDSEVCKQKQLYLSGACARVCGNALASTARDKQNKKKYVCKYMCVYTCIL